MTELYFLFSLAIGVEKYQERMRENVEKKIVGGFPLNFERSLASRQLLLSGKAGKKKRAINKNKIQKQNINILFFYIYFYP